jgi:hypothetical protein
MGRYYDANFPWNVSVYTARLIATVVCLCAVQFPKRDQQTTTFCKLELVNADGYDPLPPCDNYLNSHFF